MTSSLTIGSPAPDFTLNTNGGGTVTLSDFKGQNVILYFYPKDDTPGCTKQAIGFSEHINDFDAKNVKIIGVSRDSVAKHDKFTAKHNLGITLGADEAGEVTESYGVWVEKSMYGKTYMGIERATYLINAEGKIEQIWRKVRVKNHIADLLEALA